MQKILLDIESYPNFFCCAVRTYKGDDGRIFEISDRRDDRIEFADFINGYTDFVCTFNGVHFDTPVVLYVVDNIKYVEPKDINYFVNLIISDEYWFRHPTYKKYKYHKKWYDVDIFLYWAQKVRKDRKISLKGLGIQMKYHTVQELPYPPGTILTHSQMDEVAYYCSVHDLNILEMLVEKKEEEIKIRADIFNEYRLNAFSADNIKIAGEILLQEYTNELYNMNPDEFPGHRAKYHLKKQLREQRFYPEGPIDFSDFKPDFQIKSLKDIFEKVVKTSSLNEYFLLFDEASGNPTRLPLSLGDGGIHSVNDREKYFSDSTYVIITSDIASLYPRLIELYNLIRFPQVRERYSLIKKLRLSAKKLGLVIKDAFYKLVLNGVSGLLDLEHSWLNFPENASKMRIMGQLILCKTVEEIILNSNFKVLSANTDGIEVLIKRSDVEKYFDIIRKVENQFDITFEHEYYKSIHYLSVNDYIAIYENNPKKKVKQKGSFVTNPELGNSTDFLIIPKALEEYFLNGTPIDQFLESKNSVDDIFDFCASQKIGKSYTVMHNGKKQQNLNRYYASTKGAYLYKERYNINEKTGEKKLSRNHMLKSSGVTIYNNHNFDKFPDDVNYHFYRSKIQTIINHFANVQATLFN